MSKDFMVCATFIIASSFILCLISQIFGIGKPSTATVIGAALGIVISLVYYVVTNEDDAA